MIARNDLIGWLEGIDKKLKKKMRVIAVGGTAMTLLNLKPSTRDIDFCLDSKDLDEFKKALDGKFKVDVFVDGFIFSEQLPDDYADLSKELIKMKNITLLTLSPIDIIITKAARFNARDEEDIAALAKFVKRRDLIERFSKVAETYAGREEDYRYHFDIIIKRFFK